MEQPRGYSIWILPQDELSRTLKKIITRLSIENDGPIFDPHVTIIGEIEKTEKELIRETSKLASNTIPFEIELTSIDYLNEYFRSIFIRAKKTESITTTNLKAQHILWNKQTQEYMPHLSIMYGNVTIDKKKKIIASINERFSKRFDVRSLFLFSTQGDPTEWYKVKEFSLR